MRWVVRVEIRPESRMTSLGLWKCLKYWEWLNPFGLSPPTSLIEAATFLREGGSAERCFQSLEN
eukprot:12557883-Prorocentrum_lima.AAC.1